MLTRPSATVLALAALTLLPACDSAEAPGEEAPDYNRAYVTAFSQLAMPFANEQGQAWDTFSGPDVLFVLFDANNDEIARGITYDDITPQALPLRWPMAPQYEVTDFDKSYYIAVYDEDVASYELIATTHLFQLQDFADDGFATDSTFSNGNGTLAGRVELRWAE